MSILSSLYHGEERDLPNDVHNEPRTGETQESADADTVLTQGAQRRMKAYRQGHTRPALYYTAQEQKPCAHGVWESAHTVASRLESKEEYPQG